MSAIWCPVLPISPLASAYTESEQDPTIRSANDTGPVKVRRRFTATVETFTVAYHVTSDELDQVIGWYRSTLSYGATSFDWHHPRTGDPVTARLVGPPAREYVEGKYKVTLQVEVLP